MKIPKPPIIVALLLPYLPFLLLPMLLLPAIQSPAAAAEPAPLAFSSDGTVLAAAAEGATVALWQVETGKKVATLYKPKAEEYLRGSALVWTPSMLFSPDGKVLATQRGDEPIQLWHVADGKPMAVLSDGGIIADLQFSADGKLLLAIGHEDKVSGQNRLTLWQADTGKEWAAQRAGEQAEFLDAAFSPDGKNYMAVVGSRERDTRTIRIWDSGNNQQRASLEGAGARFSPAGNALAVWDAQGRLTLWDPHTGERRLAGARKP